jgi:uncharacterized protein YkwD
MHPLRVLLIVTLAVIAACGATAPVANEEAPAGTPYRQASLRADAYSRRAERQILDMLNHERRSRRLPPLVLDESLTQAARLHSRQMAYYRQLSHRLRGESKYSHRLNQVGLRFDTSGENVALASDAEEAHQALMRSPGHRANILDRDFNSVGIGVVASARGIYVTQDFARLLPRANADEAEASVARSLNQMRSAAGAPRLRRLPAPELRDRACEMANDDHVDPRAAMLPRAANAIAFTAGDLGKLSQPLRGLEDRPASAFSVGACYRASRSYESPVFWILVATYR